MDPLPLALLPPGLLLRPACLPACLQSGCRQSTRAGGRPSCATTAGRPGRRHSTLFTTAAGAAAPTTPASSEPRPLSHLLSVHVGFLAFSLIPCTCCSTLPRPTSGGGCGGRRALAGPATAPRSTGLHCKTAFVASCGGRIAPPTACKGPFLGRGAVPGCPLRRRRNRRKRSCLGPRAPQFSLCLRALSVLDSQPSRARGAGGYSLAKLDQRLRKHPSLAVWPRWACCATARCRLAVQARRAFEMAGE
jgi:hypothetical protein